MTNILEALTKLDQSLGHLETACEKQEHAVSTRRLSAGTSQHDLFGGAQQIDPAFLAKKLDVAIERVETVLREG